MTIYGYARASMPDQVADLDAQVTALKAAGCKEENIFHEQADATKGKGRTEFARLMAKLGNGDALVFTSLSRVARSMNDLIELASKLEAVGATIHILDINLDTSTDSGKTALNLCGAIALGEYENRLEQEVEYATPSKEANADEESIVTTVDKTTQVIELHNEGVDDKTIAATAGVGTASVHVILGDAYPS